MKTQERLGNKEITMILINVITLKLFFTFPRRLVITAGNGAWLEMIYVSLLGAGVLLATLFAYKNFPNKDIIDISHDIGGRWLKGIVGVLVSVTLFFNLVSVLRAYPDMVKLVLLPDTTVEMIVLVFASVIAIGAYLGIESIARIHALFIPFVIGVLIVFVIFLIPHIELYNIFPVLGKGAKPIFIDGFENIDIFDDLIILNLLIPFAKNVEVIEKSGKKAVLISSLIGIALLFIYCTIYPYPASERFLVPVYQMTRLVGVGDFFQRFEAFFEFIWSLLVFLYSGLYLAMLLRVWKKTFNLKYEKQLIIPMTAVVVILSVSSQRLHELVFNYWYITVFVAFVAFVLPTILPIIYKAMRKKERGV